MKSGSFICAWQKLCIGSRPRRPNVTPSVGKTTQQLATTRRVSETTASFLSFRHTHKPYAPGSVYLQVPVSSRARSSAT